MIFFNKKTEDTLDHNIKIYYNIFSRKERLSLLQQVKPFLMELGSNFPGLQTPNEMHEIYRSMALFDPTIKICERMGVDESKVLAMWASFSDKDSKYPTWHNHESAKDSEQISAVYMIENPDKLSTVFKINGEDYTFKAPTNSLITYPSYYTHTGPKTKSDRYSLALDISS